jgi:hypothetical protein
MSEHRQQDLLNTLAITLKELETAGVGVILGSGKTPGWIRVEIQAYWCERCWKLTPMQVECGWCTNLKVGLND